MYLYRMYRKQSLCQVGPDVNILVYYMTTLLLAYRGHDGQLADVDEDALYEQQ